MLICGGGACHEHSLVHACISLCHISLHLWGSVVLVQSQQPEHMGPTMQLYATYSTGLQVLYHMLDHVTCPAMPAVLP